MNSAPKGKCSKCGRNFRLDLKGQKWVVPSHNVRILGKVNPECLGTGLPPA